MTRAIVWRDITMTILHERINPVFTVNVLRHTWAETTAVSASRPVPGHRGTWPAAWADVHLVFRQGGRAAWLTARGWLSTCRCLNRNSQQWYPALVRRNCHSKEMQSH